MNTAQHFPRIVSHHPVDTTAAQRQAELETHKAHYFARGGTITHIAAGISQPEKHMPKQHEPQWEAVNPGGRRNITVSHAQKRKPAGANS